MQYLVMLYDVETAASEPGSPEWDAEMAGYERFGALAGEAVVGGEALTPTAAAVAVRTVDGEVLVTDGPFGEAAEVAGGYYLLECPTLDEAIELAKEIPTASTGRVEVRPVEGRYPADPAPARSGDRWLAILLGEETEADVPGTAAWEAGAAEHGAFVASIGDAYLDGVALHPADTTTTVRVRDGETVLTDGPFAEAAEVLGGLYVIQAADRDAAVAIAAGIPTNPGGGVELRPIVELGP